MGTFSIWHWLIVLLVIILVFGTKKLKNLGSDLGGAVRGFKDGLKEGNKEEGLSSMKVTRPKIYQNRKLSRSRQKRKTRNKDFLGLGCLTLVFSK